MDPHDAGIEIRDLTFSRESESSPEHDSRGHPRDRDGPRRISFVATKPRRS